MSLLLKYRTASGLSQGALAKRAGTSQPQINRLETGDRKMSLEWALRLAPHLGISADDLLFGDRTVALVGYVGAGAEAHFYADASGEIGRAKMPPGGTERTVAVRINGESMGLPFDGWYVYFDERRDPPTDDLVGQLCVVGLASGQILVKQLMRGRAPGHFDLWSTNARPLTDVAITWAARVTAMLPPAVADVLDSQDAPGARPVTAVRKPAGRTRRK